MSARFGRSVNRIELNEHRRNLSIATRIRSPKNRSARLRRSADTIELNENRKPDEQVSTLQGVSEQD